MQRLGAMAAYLAMATMALMISACGAGDEFVTGIANGHNTFYANRVVDELAKKLTNSGAVGPVTDEMLRTSFDAIARAAAEGEPEAALILFRVAEAQREKDQ